MERWCFQGIGKIVNGYDCKVPSQSNWDLWGTVSTLVGSKGNMPETPAVTYLRPEISYFWTVLFEATIKISKFPLWMIPQNIFYCYVKKRLTYPNEDNKMNFLMHLIQKMKNKISFVLLRKFGTTHAVSKK